jgi:gluconate 2-dehydrogenase gamma chain
MASCKRPLVLTRRQFVSTAVAGSAAAIVGCAPAKPGDGEFFSEDQARTLAVICDEIIPADEFPSASQAGVITYIDRQLVRYYRRHRDTYKDGLIRAEATSVQRFGKRLSELSPTQRLELVASLEKENRPFFELVRNHTFEGYYGSPRHGGNRDAVSWRMLGLPNPPLRGRAQYDLEKGSSS